MREIRNLKTFFRNNDGFTLPELLVTTLIFVIVVGGIYMVLITGDKSWQTNRVAIEIQQELRKSMERMKDDIRQAGDVSIVDVPADGAWYSSITFKIPYNVVSGGVNWSDNIQYVLGGSDGTQLQRISGAETKVIAQGIQTFQMRRLSTSGNLVEVSLIGQNTTPMGTPVSYQLDFSIQLRN